VTRYIGEPSPEKKLAEGRALTESLARRPAPEVPPVTGAGNCHWIAVATSWELTSGAESTVGWVQLWQSEGSSTYFDYETQAGGGQLGETIAHPRMKQSGIYTFTLDVRSSDLSAVHPKLRLQTRTQVLAAGTVTTPVYPAGTDTDQQLQAIWQFNVSDGSGDDMWVPSSWTIPVRHTNAGTAIRIGKTKIGYVGTQTGSTYWSLRLWIIRHPGEVNWTPGHFGTPTFW